MTAREQRANNLICVWQRDGTARWRMLALVPYGSRREQLEELRREHPGRHLVMSFTRPRQL
jgi:hypothetical protein